MKEGTREELADFLRFCASERRLAPMTCSAYERDVSACLDYLRGQGNEDLAEVRVTHLRAFLAEEPKRRPAVSSQARTTSALKAFFRFLVEEERLARDPALPLRTPKKREALPDVLTMVELERLLVQPARDELWERYFPGKPERDRLLLALMAYAGLRRSELLGLEWDDVDLSRRLLRIRRAKGGRQRMIPIHPALAPLFAAYYATRVPLTEQAIFVGVQGKPLNYTQLGQVFRHYVDAAGVNERKRVTPHTLRHVLHGDRGRASKALTYLAESGYFEKVRQRLWVRAGTSANPYRLGARVTSPYAFAYGTALALHGATASQRSEVLVSSPRRFKTFEYDGALYRRALPWPEGALVKVSVGPEFVRTTMPERTLVDCVRVPTNAGGMAELLRGVGALPRVDGEELLRWVEHYGEANLAARLGFVLESGDVAGHDATLLEELERRRPRARVYLEPGTRGGRLLKRWNLIVPRHLLFSPGEETRNEP